MLYIDLLQKLKKLNRRIFIVGSETQPDRPWGIYVCDQYGVKPPQHICGINGNRLSIPELTQRRWDGSILLQGWRRILRVLADKKVIDIRKAEQVFGTDLRGRKSSGIVVEKDPLTRAMNEAKERGLKKTGMEDYVDLDDLMDIHRWREKLRQDKSNYWA